MYIVTRFAVEVEDAWEFGEKDYTLSVDEREQKVGNFSRKIPYLKSGLSVSYHVIRKPDHPKMDPVSREVW